MSTAVFELALSIPNRMRELKTLIRHARESEAKDEELYNILCRGCCVLIASHLEGFLKELTSCLLLDLNDNLGSFASMPAAMQRTFCERIAFYEQVPKKELEERIKQLLAFFTKNSVTIDLKAFSYKNNPNKNPSASLIDNTFSKLGIPFIINSISRGQFEVVFDNDTTTNYVLLRDIVRFRSRLYHFPYRRLPHPYDFKKETYKKQDNDQQSLWHTFIEETLTRRHKVAHGDTLSNETTWQELQSDTTKLEVLMHGILYSSAAYFSES